MSRKKKKPNKPSKTFTRKGVAITKTLDILKVYWEDHFSGNHAWVHDPSDLRTEPLINVSIGFKVHEDKKTLTLAQNLGENQTMSDTTTVLKNCIVSTTKMGTVEYGRTDND